jgi:hypothetical protein
MKQFFSKSDFLPGLYVALLLVMMLSSKYSWPQCNLDSMRTQLAGCEQSFCSCDVDTNGVVNATDLLIWLPTVPPGSGGETISITPRWNNFYNDAGLGFDGFMAVPTVDNPGVTWEDIKDDCIITWLIDGIPFWQGNEMVFNQIDLGIICSGAFPCTLRINYRGYIFERTEPTWLNIQWTDQAASCDYGLTVIDADVAGFLMNPFFNPSAEPLFFCTNCTP